MNNWENRNFEEANLLNPAFLSLLIYESALGYYTENKNNIPFLLPFIIISIVLHKGTREVLPKSVNTPFATWISRQEVVRMKIGFSKRARSLTPYIKEAILFGIFNNLFTIENDIITISNKNKPKNYKNYIFTKEVSSCFDKARFCGKWFEKSGKIDTIMTLIGVKP